MRLQDCLSDHGWLWLWLRRCRGAGFGFRKRPQLHLGPKLATGHQIVLLSIGPMDPWLNLRIRNKENNLFRLDWPFEDVPKRFHGNGFR